MPADILTSRPDPPAATTPAAKAPSAQDIVKSLEDQYAENIKQIRSIFGPPVARSAEELGSARSEEIKAQGAVAKAGAEYAQPRPTPPLPGMIQQPPVPNISARPFMDNPQAKDTLGNVVSLLGTMAQMAMAGRAPVAALNAFSGAMTGWAEGDRVRAQREWTQYLAQVDKINADNITAQRQWEDAMRVHGSNELAARARYIVSLDDAGLKERATQAARQGMQDSLGMLQYFTGEADKLRDHTMQANKYVLEYQLKEEIQRGQLDLRKSMEEARIQREKDRHQEALDRYAETQRHNRVLEGIMMERREDKLDAPSNQSFWDTRKGEVSNPTQRELIADARNPERQYKHLLPNQVPLIDRLAVARPALDALDKLIDQIGKAAPGENITNGLIQRLKRTAGIGEQIAKFTALKFDVAIENAAAVSQGTPRISILYMIRDEASPSEMQTIGVAKGVNDMARTTIGNRLTGITGDPKAFEKASSNLAEYNVGSSEGPPPGFKPVSR